MTIKIKFLIWFNIKTNLGLLYSLGGNIPNLFKKSEKIVKKKLEEDEEGRLIQIKGRKRVFVRRVEFSVHSMNEGDVFLLDTGSMIYQWNGPKSNRFEKAKAMDIAKTIKDKEGRVGVVVIEDGMDNEKQFWSLLGKTDKQKIASEVEGGDDLVAEKTLWENVKLYRICTEDSSGPLENPELQEIGCNKLLKEQLLPNETYVLDSATEVFCWTGKKSSPKAKTEGMKIAQKMLDLRTNFWTAPLRREFQEYVK